MKNTVIEKVRNLVQLVISDARWNLRDELMCQVLGYSLFGYGFGLGRLVGFLEEDEIFAIVKNELIRLGLGEKYAQGLIAHAFEVFQSDKNDSIHSQLIGVGHSHFSSSDMKEFVNSIFENTEIIRKIK